MAYKALIFDLDGTILDTLADLTASTNAAMQMNGYPLRTIEEVRQFVGNGILKLIERAVPKGTEKALIEKTLEDFKIHYKAHCADFTKPYDGVIELLQRFKSEGYLMAVVSNKADFAVQQLCEDYFKGLFDFVVGEREGIRKKPSPDSVFEVMDVLKVKKEDCVYIGDSEVDVATAVNAGLDCIAVTWGFRSEAFLLENGAALFAHDPEELYHMISGR